MSTSNDSAPQTKRRRTSSTSPDPPLRASTVKPSLRFWYADGNVVLQAEETQFRVHRSLLSLHSEIMKDCFECPQPVDDDLVEGCPVIHLTDSAKDMDILCGLLYGVYHTDDDIIDFDYLAAMIRLGRKYDFLRFKNKALKYLRQLFPRNLKEWLAVHNDNSLLTKIIELSEGFLFHVINLAYENDIPSILPAAIICLCMKHDLREIVAGLVNPNGETVVALQPAALSTCILGRAAFTASWAWGLRKQILFPNGEIDLVPVVPSPQCKQRSTCQRNLCFVLGEVISMGTTTMGTKLAAFPTNELDYYFLIIESDNVEGIKFCEHCKDILDMMLERQQRKWWAQLPGNFNLPAWEMIKDFDMV